MVQVYRNLHKDMWSIRSKGIVIGHAQELILENCKFVVQPAGRAKVLIQRRKNVHAYVKGNQSMSPNLPTGDWVDVTYNPYKFDYFYRKSDNSRIESCRAVMFLSNGKLKVLE